jgi:hypothetical protein
MFPIYDQNSNFINFVANFGAIFRFFRTNPVQIFDLNGNVENASYLGKYEIFKFETFKLLASDPDS